MSRVVPLFPVTARACSCTQSPMLHVHINTGRDRKARRRISQLYEMVTEMSERIDAIKQAVADAQVVTDAKQEALAAGIAALEAKLAGQVAEDAELAELLENVKGLSADIASTPVPSADASGEPEAPIPDDGN